MLQDQSILNAQKLVTADQPQMSTINFLMKMAHRCATFQSRRNEDPTTIREDLINLDANPTDITEGIQPVVLFPILNFIISINVVLITNGVCFLQTTQVNSRSFIEDSKNVLILYAVIRRLLNRIQT